MATPVIKIKRNNSGTAPTSLVYGELAADIFNKKLYIGDSSDSPVLIGLGTSASGTPSGVNGEIQIASSTGFSSLTYCQLLNNSSVFSINNIITVPTQDTSYAKVNFPFNNIFLENDIVGISVAGGASANYLIKNVTNSSFKAYSLPTSSGGGVGSLQTFNGSNSSSFGIIPITNSSSPVFFTGTLKTPASGPSTITVGSAIINNFKVGMQLTSGTRPIIIRGARITTGTSSITINSSDTFPSIITNNCYVDMVKSARSIDSNANTNTSTIVGLFSQNDNYISSISSRTITFNGSIIGNFSTDDPANGTKITDTEIIVDIIVYQKGSIRSNTFITHIDTSSNILTLNQRQHNETDSTGMVITGYATAPEKQVFSFGTPLIKTSSNIIANESISLIKQMNDAGRNLEQKILFKSPEAYTISGTINTASFTLTTKNNLAEICVGDIVLYGTSSTGTSHITPTTFTYIKSINYNTGVLTLNNNTTTNGLSGVTQLTIRSSRYVKSVIEHRSFPYSNYDFQYRYTTTNKAKSTAGYRSGDSITLDYDLSTNNLSYESSLWSNGSAQTGSVNNLGSINDMGLYICSDTSIKIGMSAISRGACTDNNFSKEPIDSILPHIAIEPATYSSSYYNEIFIKNISVTSKPNLDNSNYFYVLGCRSSTPRKNDGFNFLTWYRLAGTSVSTLVGGSGTTVNPKEEINEITGLPETIISLADEVPINTSLTVPLIKGTQGGDLNITLESPENNINIAIPQSNTDVALSSGSIYITSGLDAGDVYVQSAEDIYLTSQTTRVSGNLIVDGYVQAGNGIIGDTTDGEEEISGLYLDGGSF